MAHARLVLEVRRVSFSISLLTAVGPLDPVWHPRLAVLLTRHTIAQALQLSTRTVRG